MNLRIFSETDYQDGHLGGSHFEDWANGDHAKTNFMDNVNVNANVNFNANANTNTNANANANANANMNMNMNMRQNTEKGQDQCETCWSSLLPHDRLSSKQREAKRSGPGPFARLNAKDTAYAETLVAAGSGELEIDADWLDVTLKHLEKELLICAPATNLAATFQN